MSAQTTASDEGIYIHVLHIYSIVHCIDMSDNNNGKRNSDQRKKG